MSGLWTTEDSMTRRRGESRIRWVSRLAATFVRRGFPTFRTGDHLAIIADAAQAVLGDTTGTVEEVVAPFGDWEYRVVADDPEEAEATIYPDEGTVLAAKQIEPISANAPEDRP
jgi:uncharacterized protein (DUF3820 family)